MERDHVAHGCYSARRSPASVSAMKDRPQMPRMPWYPSSFYASTRTWPFLTRAIYRELLDTQWDAGGLPSDQETLRTMLGVTAEQWRAAWPLIQPKFELGSDGLLRNRRLELHRETALELSGKRRGAANKRWGNDQKVVPIK